MGMDNEHAHVTGRPWLCLDIETRALPDVEQYLPEAKPRKGTKDEAKIAAQIEAKLAALIAGAALDLDLCEIVAIGFTTDRMGSESDVHTRGWSSEAGMIVRFWQFVRVTQEAGGVLVGYNVLSFDLPALLRRSLYLGIPTPTLALDKYRHDGIIDLLAVLSHNGQQPMRSLNFYAKRFRILHDDSVSGAEIPALAAAGEWDQIAGHCRADVQTTAALAVRMGLICLPAPEPAAQVA